MRFELIHYPGCPICTNNEAGRGRELAALAKTCRSLNLEDLTMVHRFALDLKKRHEKEDDDAPRASRAEG